jgi:hypothetical protein
MLGATYTSGVTAVFARLIVPDPTIGEGVEVNPVPAVIEIDCNPVLEIVAVA